MPCKVRVPEPFLIKVPAPPVIVPPLSPTMPATVTLPVPPIVKLRPVLLPERPKVESKVRVIAPFTKSELLASEVVAAPAIWIFCEPWKKAEVPVVPLPKTTVFVSLFAPVRLTADWK